METEKLFSKWLNGHKNRNRNKDESKELYKDEDNFSRN